jgi:GT2 family glycosyltransferase
VIVVDNASSDGTAAAVTSAWPSVRVIRLEENSYSAGGRNAGAAAANGEYVFFVDDDNILDASCIAALADAMERDPGLGMTAPIMLDYGRPGIIWCAGGSLNAMGIAIHRYAGMRLADLALPPTIPAEYFPNAYMIRMSLIRRGIVHDTVHFPHNWAEQDISARIRGSGSRLATVSAAITQHDIGYGGMFTRIGVETTYDQSRSRFFYRRMYLNSAAQWAVFILFLFPVSTLWYMLAFASRRGDFAALARAYVKGTLDGMRMPL